MLNMVSSLIWIDSTLLFIIKFTSLYCVYIQQNRTEQPTQSPECGQWVRD
jgi:hypothetical protein